jgi:hypothetical protein
VRANNVVQPATCCIATHCGEMCVVLQMLTSEQRVHHGPRTRGNWLKGSEIDQALLTPAVNVRENNPYLCALDGQTGPQDR